MQNFESLIKNSIEKERQFSMPQDGWERIQSTLRNKRRNKLLAFAIPVFLTIGLGTFILLRSNRPVLTHANINQLPIPQEEQFLDSHETQINSSIIDAPPVKQLEQPSDTPKSKATTPQTGIKPIAPIEQNTLPKGPIFNKINPPKQKEQALLALNQVFSTSITETSSVEYRIEPIATLPPTNLIKTRRITRPISKQNLLILKSQLRRSYFPQGSYGITLVPAALMDSIPMLPKSWGVWHFGITVGALLSSNTRWLGYSRIAPAGSNAQFNYRTRDGQVVGLNQGGSVTDEQIVGLNLIRFALGRRFRNGLSVKASLLFASDQFDNENLISDLPNEPDLFYFRRQSNNQYFLLELGTQYTFRRSRRFQPHIGLSVYSNFWIRSTEENTALAPSIGLNELDFRDERSSTGLNLSFLGYYGEIGGQYFLTPNVSIGPNVFVTTIDFSQELFGIGITGRYIW